MTNIRIIVALTACSIIVVSMIWHLLRPQPELINSTAMVFPGTSWDTRAAAQLGLDVAKLDQFALNVGGTGVIIKDGYLVKTWGSTTSHGEWGSASKAMFSTLMGFAIQEGQMGSVDDLIKDHGWSLSAVDQTMTFRHLANMVSGYTLPEKPGTAWGYNDYGAKLWKHTILDKVYNVSPSDSAAIETLFTASNRLGPLQFQDGSLFVIKKGMPRVNMSPRDFARMGWFWINKGNWAGQQLLPKSFFDAYMKVGVPAGLSRTVGGGPDDYLGLGSDGGGNDMTQYGPGRFGFMWWFNPNQSTWPDAPADTFQVIGHRNKELMAMIPSLGIVAAARGNWGSSDVGNPAFGINQNLKLLKEAMLSAPLN